MSRVFTVVKVEVADLRRYPGGLQIDSQIRSHDHWQHWEKGLQAIAQRATSENWQNAYDPHRLYFLLVPPESLDHTIKKCGRLPQIPHGYGTAFARLKTARCISELTL